MRKAGFNIRLFYCVLLMMRGGKHPTKNSCRAQRMSKFWTSVQQQ